MNDLASDDKGKTKKTGSLSRSLVAWFLILSLVPLSIVSWFSYQQVHDALTEAAANALEESSNVSANYITSWFERKLTDINYQSEDSTNSKLLTSLIKGFDKSKKPLSDYIKSTDWEQRIEGLQNEIIDLQQNYDYIYDIYLIDLKGNVLFNVSHELDLGTNIITGIYKNTLFSASVKKTLTSDETLFSDIEAYTPSNNLVSGFITAPLLDENDTKIGVFAAQIIVDNVFDKINHNANGKSSLTHYLVGSDGRLRTSIDNNTQDILSRVMDTIQVKHWMLDYKYGAYNDENNAHEDPAFDYIGPNKKRVIGHHKVIYLPGVKWALISEIDQDEALAAVNWLAKVSLMLFFITTIIVVVLSMYLSNRITKPITLLLNATRRAAMGKENKVLIVESNNEIGQLAESFNYMLYVRKRHEDELEQTTAQAELAYLELTEQKFALDQHSIVAITDVRGEIKFVNKKFSEISGYDYDELIGKNHRILNSGVHNTSFFTEMYRTIAKGNVWNNEVCNKAKDGRLYWVDTTIVPFIGDDGKPKSYIAIRTDITNRKKIDLDLIDAKEKAEAATQQKSEFLANMSHEIRTPMNGVIGMTGLLLDTELTNKQRSYAESTMLSAEALLAIINDILDFSKIEAGKMELEILPFDLRTVMEDVAELMAMKCREKNIEMLLHFKSGTETNLLGDPGRIRQVLLNLLSNAIKFTEQGSVVLSVESSDIINEETIVSVSVSDSGIGIDDDKLDKIFNKFDQEDGSTTRKYGGTGLGLAICRQLCHLMKGEIKAESIKGKGSVFSFTMCLTLTDEVAVSSLSMGGGEKLKGLKTLIVDDLDIARTILVEQLSSLDLNINTAVSAKDALSQLNAANEISKPFDIVITDFHMPEMDGEMFAEKIKENNLLDKGALLFITSSPRKGDGARLQKLGFDGYLTKPTRAFEVPHILTLIWQSKIEGKKIPLVTRHMVQEVKTGNKKRLKLKHVHILLSEDNPVNQMVATEYLERYGCRVTPAGNGLEAVAQFKENNFDLVFMDCQMPEMDGYEATGVIRQWEALKNIKRTIIIAFTANAMQGDREKCLSSGMDDYISKPISEKSLEDVLKKWLTEKVKMVEYNEEENTSPLLAEVLEFDKASQDKNTLDLPIFNVLKNMFGDAFPAAVGSHTTSAKENVERIEKAIVNNDSKELEHAAHSLKGASGQFGAMVLSELAKQLEQLAKEDNIDKAKHIFPKLKAEREDVEKAMLKELS